MQSENLEKLTINYLTEAEYAQAKANGKLKDDELYMTPDDSGFGSVDVYSTEEVKTNKVWNDGRTVYRKLIKFGEINSGVMYEIAYDFSDVLELTKIYGTFVSEEGYVSPIDFTLSADTTYAVSVQAWTSKNKLRVWPSSKIKIMNAWILLEYTKKDDATKDIDTIQELASNLVYEKVLTEATSEIIINGLDIVADGGTYEVYLETNNGGGLTWICYQINGRTDTIFTNKKIVQNSANQLALETDSSKNFGIMGATTGGSIQNLCQTIISFNKNTVNSINNSAMGTPANQYFANSTAYSQSVPIENVNIIKIFNENNSAFVAGTKVKIYKKIAYNMNTITKEKDVYSTTETKTNKVWIDGKPIYRTVLVTTKPNTDIAHNIQNIDVITDLTTKVKQTSGMYFKADLASTFANKTIYVVYNDKLSNITGEFTTILEYTKTTD